AVPVSSRFRPSSSRPDASLFPYTTLFRSCSNVILMAMRQHDGANLRSVLLQVGNVRDNQVDAQKLGFREHHAGVDDDDIVAHARSEEHTSELQSPYDLVCRLLLEKKKRIL